MNFFANYNIGLRYGNADRLQPYPVRKYGLNVSVESAVKNKKGFSKFMSFLNKQIKRVKKVYTNEQIHLFFVRRTHDSLFREVGELDFTSREAQMGEHLVIWRGYQLLVDSKYLDQ